MTYQFEVPVLGDAPCPVCGQTVMFAWDDAMQVFSLEPDDGGDMAVSEDPNHIPWCRVVTNGQLAFDESLYRIHNPRCEALNGHVRHITTARSALRHQPPSNATRSASAR